MGVTCQDASRGRILFHALKTPNVVAIAGGACITPRTPFDLAMPMFFKSAEYRAGAGHVNNVWVEGVKDRGMSMSRKWGAELAVQCNPCRPVALIQGHGQPPPYHYLLENLKVRPDIHRQNFRGLNSQKP
ncbi:hypothetical protein MLD38_024153 [Melastoma candidum]|uniref:Uncharacterized protein n=1 Tax=Melastoma candidum TaxID=119954 RepID=A0ACB9NUU5_9MYRT|nr:hypothetical protein MLD38_024153 [Melastoma candidum]